MRHGKCDEYDTRGNVEMQWKLRCVAIILYRGIWRWSTVVIGWQRMDQTVRIGWVGWCAKNECVPVVGWLGICGHREKKEKVLDDVDIFAWHVFYVSFWNFVIGFSDRSTGWFCSLGFRPFCFCQKKNVEWFSLLSFTNIRGTFCSSGSRDYFQLMIIVFFYSWESKII